MLSETSPPSSRAISVLGSGSDDGGGPLDALDDPPTARAPGRPAGRPSEEDVVRMPLPDQLAQYVLDFPVGLGDGASVALGPHGEPAGG
ncbi:hypothetical protein [Streptomyces sp. NPDC047043]|uniref:hypothetical protein n=1 Tax=Streptomyces sp. NPDC047043 TaxID=3154497 RepID=UPI003405192B